MKYLIKKTVPNGRPVYLTDGLSQILEINDEAEAEALAQALREKNPGNEYEVVPAGRGRGAA